LTGSISPENTPSVPADRIVLFEAVLPADDILPPEGFADAGFPEAGPPEEAMSEGPTEAMLPLEAGKSSPDDEPAPGPSPPEGAGGVGGVEKTVSAGLPQAARTRTAQSIIAGNTAFIRAKYTTTLYGESTGVWTEAEEEKPPRRRRRGREDASCRYRPVLPPHALLRAGAPFSRENAPFVRENAVFSRENDLFSWENDLFSWENAPFSWENDSFVRENALFATANRGVFEKNAPLFGAYAIYGELSEKTTLFMGEWG
jgi:hypothetical protein